MLRSNADWIKKRCRRYIPPPPILMASLKALLEEYQKDTFRDPITKMPLFNSTTTAEFIKQLDHVMKGCLSDLIDLQLYSLDYVEQSTGLNIWK